MLSQNIHGYVFSVVFNSKKILSYEIFIMKKKTQSTKNVFSFCVYKQTISWLDKMNVIENFHTVRYAFDFAIVKIEKMKDLREIPLLNLIEMSRVVFAHTESIQIRGELSQNGGSEAKLKWNIHYSQL